MPWLRLLCGITIATAVAFTTLQAQIPGRNVNMVSGVGWPDGDPFLQRQNEPSVAASTRNPLHLLGGSNDYRTVDLPNPGSLDDDETGDAWLGLYKSTDGGQRWASTLLPGYPQDQSPAGMASPLKGYQAGADPVVRAGTNGLFYYSGLVFDRGDNGKSGIFVSRFIDNNNQEAGDPVAYLGTTMVAAATNGAFLDKPWMAVDIPRPGAATCLVTADRIIPTTETLRRDRKRDERDRRRRDHDRGRHGDRDDDRGHGRGGPHGRPTPAPTPTGQRIKAGTVYVAYSSITGEGASLRSEIMLTRSTDCGNTWSTPIRVSNPQDQVNQGASIAIDPRYGHVYVSWRRFGSSTGTDMDGIMVARLPAGEKKFDIPCKAYGFPKAKGKQLARYFDRLFEHRPPRVKSKNVSDVAAEFDQGTSSFSFRTNAYPTTTVDGSGRLYVAWSQRGYAALRPDPVDGDARVVMATTLDGRRFTQARAVDDDAQLGHQLMPSLAFAGGKLMLVYYDLRETRAETFAKYVSDAQTVTGLRHTIDIRATMASPAEIPDFAPSVKVSDYLMGFRSQGSSLEQLQVNPPNLPMFKQGTVPFMGDYIDIAATPTFVPDGKGGWKYNTQASNALPIFHAVWTDNRDVRPPATRDAYGRPDWTKYSPVTRDPNAPPPASVYDPTQTQPICEPGNAGSRNQNIYSARITGGLLAGSPGNTKPLSADLQRAFVVFAQNATTETRVFRMTITNQPPGGRASFEQFPLPPYDAGSPPPLTAIDVTVPARSTASRTVYATSTDAKAAFNVDVNEVDAVGGAIETNGLASRVMLNPDIENPDIENPDIENPDIENPDIENAEVYNPDIENPDIENPDIENPDIENPDIENPDIENVVIANPDIENPDIENPDIENPDIENPDIENPDIENPDIENGAIADVSWRVTNLGNTTSSFNVNVFLAQQSLPAGIKTQLILRKVYKTPVALECDLRYETRNILIANIPNPTFVVPGGGVTDQNDPSPDNATLWLAPGEEGKVTLRVYDDDTSNNLIITKEDGSTVSIDPSVAPSEDITPVISSNGVNTEDAQDGQTEPDVVPAFPAPQATDDEVTTTPVTPVTLNVLANDSAAFGSTKVLSSHPAGLGQNLGGGAGEVAYMPTTGLVYVGSARTLGVVDPVTGRLAGRTPLDPSDPPITYIVPSPKTGIVFFRTGAPGASGTSIGARDARPGSPTFNQPLYLPPTTDAAIDALGTAFTFTLSPAGTTLFYAAGTPAQQTISAIIADPGSPALGTILWSVAMPANTLVSAMTVNPVTGRLYVASRNNGAVGGLYVIDPGAPAPPVKITGVDPAFSLAVNPATNLIVVAGTNGQYRFNIVDGATDTLVAQTATARGVRGGSLEDRLAIHYASGRVFLRAQADVIVLDALKGSPAFGSLVGYVPVARELGTADIDVDQDTGVVATVGPFDLAVSLIDAATLATNAVPITRAAASGRLAIDPIVHRVFVANTSTVLAIAAPAVSAAVTLGHVAVFPEAAGIFLNPPGNHAYLAGTDATTGIKRLSGAGLLAPPTVTLPTPLAAIGRYTFGGRYDATNTFIFANTESSLSSPSSVINIPGSLAIVDGGTDQATSYVPTIPRPFGVGVNQATGQVYVAGFSGQDAAGLPQSGQIGVHVMSSLAAPPAIATVSGVTTSPTPGGTIGFGRWVVVNPATGRVYVMLLNTNTNVSAVFLEPTSGLAAPTATGLDVAALAGLTPDDRVEVIRVDPTLNRVYFGLDNQLTNSYHVVAIDGSTHALVGVYAGGGHSRLHTASWLALNDQTHRLYVVNYNGNSVTMLDAATLAPMATTALPAGPSATAVNLTENRLYVSNLADKSITALNGSTLAVLSTVKLPLQALFMVVDEVESRIYTSGGNSFDESGAMVVTDVLGKLGTDVSVTSVGTAGGGVVTLNADYSVTYTPAPGFSGDDTFTYNVHNKGGDATGTVTVHVLNVVGSPIANPDGYSVWQRQTAGDPSLVVAAPGPLGNDAAEPGASMQVVASPAHGVLVPNWDGSFTYTPAVGYVGPDSFTYQASDDYTSNVATVSINVLSTTLVVTNTNDSGPGSLRNAITVANGTVPRETIAFNIPGAGPATPAVILVNSPLPPITKPVAIDGSTQPGYDGLPVVEVRYNGAAGGVNGLTIGFDLSNVTVRGLAITKFSAFGIQSLQSDSLGGPSGFVIENNYLGTNRFGAAGLGNAAGLEVRTDTAEVLGNVIAGNAGTGILLDNDADGVHIAHNKIGTADGTTALANGSGIVAYDYVDNPLVEDNVISGNAGFGIDVQKSAAGTVTGMVIRGNTIGLGTGGAALANLAGGIRTNTANGLVIGQPGVGNIISGNDDGADGGPGITVYGAPGSPMPSILANYIGTDPTGQLARPNRFEGIVLEAPAKVGGPGLGDGNLIAGNGNAGLLAGTGIEIITGAGGSVIQGNQIGLNVLMAPLGNGYSGITVSGQPGLLTLIGGDAPGEANIISGNPAAGITLYTVGGPGPNEITVAGNSIYGNGGLGMDIDNDGVTPNDPGDTDLGTNLGMNFPVLSNAVNGVAATTQVDYDATNILGGPWVVRFFANTTCDSSGYGEGERYVGKLNLGAAGTGTMVLNELVPIGQFITANITDRYGDTSEFSACATVALPAPPAVISSATPNPVAAGFGQMITLTGSNLPGVNWGDVIVNVGGIDYPANYAWTNGPTKVIARLAPGTPAGAATIRVKAPGGSPVSNSYPITVSTAPAAPVLEGVYDGACGTGYGGGTITTTKAANTVTVAATGIDTTGTTFVWTPLFGGGAVSTSGGSTCASPSGGVAVQGTVPAFAPGTVVKLEITAAVSAVVSPASNAVILTVEGTNTLAGTAGGGGGSAAGPFSCAAGSAGTSLTGGWGANIDRIGLNCTPLAYPMTGSETFVGSIGGGGGAPYTQSCPAGMVLTGIFGEHGLVSGSTPGTDVISTLGVQCKTPTALAGPVSYSSGLVGTSYGFAPYAISCPAGMKVVEISGRGGALVDQISVTCR